MLDTNNTMVVGIDIQQKLVNMLPNNTEIAKNCSKFLQAINILNIPTILTEQYPKGLGSTIEEIINIKDFKRIEKTTFSALKTNEFKIEFEKLNNKNILLFGIETHICVLQTAIDLLKNGYNVFIIKDCCSSRSKQNHKTALELIKQEGCRIITTEITLFEFLKSSSHPDFKSVQALIK